MLMCPFDHIANSHLHCLVSLIEQALQIGRIAIDTKDQLRQIVAANRKTIELQKQLVQSVRLYCRVGMFGTSFPGSALERNARGSASLHLAGGACGQWIPRQSPGTRINLHSLDGIASA